MAEWTTDGDLDWSPDNPFNVTKATDLSDEEIHTMWVDLGTEGGYRKVIDPRLSMPRILLGGKGTGRTHLMRYLSAPLQRLRSKGGPAAAPLEEGYIGIYLRCTGLNASRFGGKDIAPEAWEAVFTYSMDLWLARLALSTACEMFSSFFPLKERESLVAGELAAAFDDFPLEVPETLQALGQTLALMQAELDLAVNNAALTRSLESVSIRIGRGKLPFLVPQIIGKHVPELGKLTWLYLVDELENLTETQQRYVQTLIREREDPTSFILGTRTYGFRTKETLSAGEENKEGSEYAAVELDQLYIEHPVAFGNFCRKIVAKRLADAGYNHVVAEQLDRFFYQPDRTHCRDPEVAFVMERTETVRRYLSALRTKLEQGQELDADRADAIVDAIRLDDHPVLERLNVMLLYKSWGAKVDLLERAQGIGQEARAFAEKESAPRYREAMKHYGSDVVAKLLQEYGRKQRYLGIDTFVWMAGGLPRNLLIILRNVVRAAEFNGEVPFREKPLAEGSQRAGVLRAADWFYRDAKAMGEAGLIAEAGVDRIATFMRALRFADRPPEAGICTFSLNGMDLDADAKSAISTAHSWSLLREITGGQRDKNTGAIKLKFQLNPMLAPRWDLPVTRRGTLALSKQEVRAIFSAAGEREFEEVRRDRVARASVSTTPPPERGRQGNLLDGGS